MIRRLAFLALLAAPALAQSPDPLTILRNNQPPPQPFDARRAPKAPDYTKAIAWAARPGARDAADVAPAGFPLQDYRLAGADVFFIHPTTFLGQPRWNAPIDDSVLNRATDVGPIRNQASVFNGCCRVYAPRYRQMVLGGFIRWSPESAKAMDLSYQDVRRAFRQYLAQDNHGRPFFIAGHSQGARLARRLIAEEIDGKPVAGKFVAGYLLGHWIPQKWFARLKQVRACTGARDVRCVVTWSTYAEGRDVSLQRNNIARLTNAAEEFGPRPYACINPLGWTAGPARQPATLNLGGWVYGPGPRPRPVDPGLVSARCANGALLISPVRDPAYRKTLLPFGNWHNNDFQMAWMNIHQNSSARLAAWLRR